MASITATMGIYNDSRDTVTSRYVQGSGISCVLLSCTLSNLLLNVLNQEVNTPVSTSEELRWSRTVSGTIAVCRGCHTSCR